ncbi:MAG: hypothetical protein KGI11_07495 [Thaumarchaeota archaeon]|nr:hypothetical protein [Nitrososphaerota archaeon]
MIIIILLASFVVIRSYADDVGTFGIRLVPNKMIENSSGVLEVFALYNGHIFPTKIKNIAFSSTDSDIVQIEGLEDNDTGFITHIKIKANSPGTANIVIAAPGFTSQQFPITVYDDEIAPASLLIKSVPSTFSINSSPKTGYFTIELTNKNGLPVDAKTDIPITLATTNSKTVNLSTSQIIIKNGQYYAIGQFTVGQTGSAKIFASASSFQPVSTTIIVTSSNAPIIQAYVYPAKINNFATSNAYVVAQLHDNSGNEILAKEDIPISITITNSTVTGLVNTSPQDQLISSNSPLIIKKGDYEAYSPIEVHAGLNGTFNIKLSAPDGYVVSNHTAVPPGCSEISSCIQPASTTLLSTPIQLTTVTSQFLDDKSAKLDILPVLATGNSELIGIMHLEDAHGKPIFASRDFQIEVDSSDSNYLSIKPVSISKGQGVVPVFGKVGNTAPPSPLSLHIVTYDDTTIPIAINSSSVNSFKLVSDSLVPKILSQSEFPLALYLTDSTTMPTYFPDNYIPTILPNDYFHIDSKKISSGDAVDLFNAQSLSDGSTTLNIIAGNFPTSVSLSSVSSAPAKVDLSYPNPLLANYDNLMEIQVLDSNSSPRYPDTYTNIKLVSSNDSIIQLPSNITISKGGYYSTFDIIPKLPGSATISVLGNNFPLTTYPVKVENIAPTLTINSSSTVLPEETFLATIKTERFGIPLQDMHVDWKVSGATVQNADKTTDKDGTATIALMSGSSGMISISPTISGQGFNSLELKDTIKINSTQNITNGTNNTSSSSAVPSTKSFKINGVDPLPFAVVGTIAAGGILMKKKNVHLFKKISSVNNIIK